MPLVRGLGGGLWELRTDLGAREARLILAMHGGEIVLLHGFTKKTQSTPDSDMRRAAHAVGKRLHIELRQPEGRP